MHYKLLVTLNKEHADTPQEAIDYVHTYLAEEGFADQESRFHRAPADWFVIGGRWSGCLIENALQEEFFAKVYEHLGKEQGTLLMHKEVEDNQKEFQQIWKQMGGSGPSPLNRNQYKDSGYTDDAQIVDERIYDEHLKMYEGTDDYGVGGEWVILSDVRVDQHTTTVDGDEYVELTITYDGRTKVTRRVIGSDDIQDVEGHRYQNVHWVDVDYDRLNKDEIIGKWVVVVDYHT